MSKYFISNTYDVAVKNAGTGKLIKKYTEVPIGNGKIQQCMTRYYNYQAQLHDAYIEFLKKNIK